MWISVKDKLPTMSEIVLVVDCNDKYWLAFRMEDFRGDWQWCETNDFYTINNITHWQPLPPLPQEQEIETEIDIKQGISEQSKKWEDGCNAYNQERINKLAEEIKAKQEELRNCDEISNIVSSGYKALW